MKELTPDDLRALSDSRADPSARARALSRLAYWEKGKYDHLEGAVAALLDDESPFLRGEAAKTLLAGWKREKYVDRVSKFLLEDRSEDWVGRVDSAFALGQFAIYTGKRKEDVARVLVRALKNDPDVAVQTRSYEQLLRLLAPDRDVPSFDEYEFDRQKDVDWALLAPYVA